MYRVVRLYKTANYFPNKHYGYFIVLPQGLDVGCLLWAKCELCMCSTIVVIIETMPHCRDHCEYGLSQWETTLQCNVVLNWLSPYSKYSVRRDHSEFELSQWDMTLQCNIVSLWSSFYPKRTSIRVLLQYNYWKLKQMLQPCLSHMQTL